ncbi:MAG: DUF1553 domain-containing protein [Bryobacterales bacterium]|nr:DUF1553 domain-containing protein [Bryobacteraceae bacterium]MDW8354777.1 DUF1553 domain-containing protein [Bryobacterales bacterium]
MSKIVALTLALVASAAEKPIQFDRDIRPILSDNCFTCHGPDEKQRQAGLRLDTKEGLFAERNGYRIIVPGDPGQSRLYQRISHPKKALRMPPPNFHRSLTDKQIELIRTWIEQGASWKEHWAYTPPQRPPLPAVRLKSWPRNPIDYFVLARLEAENLKPSPEADRITLLRRLSFDLTGLPPTPEEIDAFLRDRSPDAYERQVDRLLASPHYGERMAMLWLDLARYADTHGYHIDSHRDMSPWRDWVIRAFNRNMPYDQFIIEQLAGDLLPNPTLEQRIATGFNRNHMINFEGGAIPEEYLNEYVADRVETVSTAFLGITMQCARCHDHKYDPIRQKEFYQLYAFFNNVPEEGLDGRYGNAKPYLELPTPAQRQKLQQLSQLICEREAALPERTIVALQEEWEKTRLATLPPDPRRGIVVHYEFDGSLADVSGGYRHATVPRGEVAFSSGPVGRSVEFSGETHVRYGDIPSLKGGPFTLAVWIRHSGIQPFAVLQKVDTSAGRRGLELSLDETIHVGNLKRGAYLYFRLFDGKGSLEIRTRERLLQSEWHHVALVYDGSGRARGVKLYLNGELDNVAVLRDNLSGSWAVEAPLETGNKATGVPYKGRLDDLRVYDRMLEPSEIEALALHHPIRSILAEPASRRSKEQNEALRRYFLTYDAPEALRRAYAELKALEREKEELMKTIPTVMVMEELPEPRETWVLGRGDYRNKVEKVEPGVPAVLPPLPEGAPRNRLGLARWLVDPAHPLTARVAVNHFWQMYFGTGLVKTAEDFGSQGEPPSHPELLDWLATEFVRTGWDVKRLQRLIVTSATYRQSSRMTPELLQKDPENRLLARGPRFRLPAEMIRDNALAVSGLLNREMYGRAVFPYQPKNLWEDIAFGDVYSAQKYVQSHGQDLYRRSLYIFWKRTAPPPTMLLFDAPDREKCIARRPRTNTPLQALALWNDATYVEAARALATRMLREGGQDTASRIRYGFRLVTGRTPAPKELRAVARVVEKSLPRFRSQPEAAKQFLAVGQFPVDDRLSAPELAAWTAAASVLLSMDETITKE